MTMTMTMTTNTRQLIQFIMNDQLDELAQAISSGTPLHEANSSGLTPASYAAYTINRDAFEMLLEAGAPWIGSEQDDGGSGIVLACAIGGNRRALQLALSRGASPMGFTKYGGSALSCCSEKGNHGCLLDLLGTGIDPDTLNPNFEFGGYAATHSACASLEDGSLDCLRALLDAGANPNSRDSKRLSPLHYAARANSLEHARLLINRGAKTFLKNADGSTALDLAIKHEAFDTTALLQAIALSASVRKPRPRKANTPRSL